MSTVGMLALALALAAPAGAATFNVNSTADEPDADTGVAACATAGGDCTLRAAIDQANFDDTDATINLPSGTYTLTGASSEDSNASGDLDVLSRGFQVTIAGAGARTTVIDGDGIDRVVHVLVRSKLAVSGVTITGGLANDDLSDGGGIYMDGGSTALTITDSTIRDNTANSSVFMGVFPDGDGGGIHTGEDSQVSISGTTITNNTAVDDGGGIENDAAGLSIVNSTIHGNTALGEGGPENAGDDLGNGGGIEHNEGQMQVVHTTITGNVADNNGGGVNVESEVEDQETPPAATFRSTILSGNQAPDAGPNCRPVAPATLTSPGTNLETGTDCGFSAAGNLQNANAQLGPLQNNGGQTDTRALSPTSPALDTATTAPCPPTDQRGTTRPQNPACDIGAYERVIQADLGVAIADSPDPVVAGRIVTYTIVGRNAGPDPATAGRITVELPSGVERQSSAIEGGGTCSGGSTLTCVLGNLAVGQARQATVTVKAPAEAAQSSAAEGDAGIAQDSLGTLAASARISAAEVDPAPDNNEAKAETSIEAGGAEEGATGSGPDPGDSGTAGVSGSGGDLPFTGLPLAILVFLGAAMLTGGFALRFLNGSGE